MKIKIGDSKVLLNSFVNFESDCAEKITNKKINYFKAFTEYAKLNYNITYINNHTAKWNDDELIFESKEDYFLFLLEWS